MTLEILAYPFEAVYISKALTTAQATEWQKTGITLTGLSVTGGKLELAGASASSVDVHDIAEETTFIRPIERRGVQDVTAVSSGVRVEFPTAPRIEVAAEFHLLNKTDGVKDVLVNSSGGTRVLQIVATSGRKWTGVVAAFDVEELAQGGETGVVRYSATFRNRGNVKPEWEG